MTAIQSEIAKTTTAASGSAKPQAGKYKGKSGAQIVHEMLINDHKVDTMFGYPGGAILPMFDQLYKTPAKFILNRHEQAAGHCADGYARATGKPGVVLVTSGPGATNTVTGMLTALMDSVPMIVLTGTPVDTTVNPGDIITLSADATDPDGVVARVDFFANGQLIGAATAFLASSSDTEVSILASFNFRISSSTCEPSARSGLGLRICHSF